MTWRGTEIKDDLTDVPNACIDMIASLYLANTKPPYLVVCLLEYYPLLITCQADIWIGMSLYRRRSCAMPKNIQHRYFQRIQGVLHE